MQIYVVNMLPLFTTSENNFAKTEKATAIYISFKWLPAEVITKKKFLINKYQNMYYYPGLIS